MVTRKGKPAAVRATVDILGDDELMRQIRRGRRYFAAGGKGVTIEQAFGQKPRSARTPSV